MDKQIEEMAKVLCIDDNFQCNTCPSLNKCFNYSHAKKLYNALYRKIPEGAVLTREEYSDYLVMKDAHQNAIERCEKLQADNERLYKNIGKFKDAARKETVEKFAERLKAKFAYDIERCKAVDEIAKEITEGE